MSEVMFINCQIVADERKTYLNGSIHVRDGKIQDIYHSPKKDYEGKVIDLKGLTMIPAFFSLDTFSVPQVGTGSYLRRDHLDDKCLGLFKDYVYDPDIEDDQVRLALINEDIDTEALKAKGIKLVLGHSDITIDEIEKLDVDAIGPLFYDMSFDPYHPSLISYALMSDKYVLLDTRDLPKITLDLAIKNIRKDRLIFIGDHLLDDMKRDIDLNDLVAYTSTNAHDLLGHPKNNGRLMRGSKADFIILDKERNYVLSYIGGRVC